MPRQRPEFKKAFSIVDSVNETVDKLGYKIKSLSVMDHIIHVEFYVRMTQAKEFEPFFFFGFNEKENKSMVVYGAIKDKEVIEYPQEFIGRPKEDALLKMYDNFVSKIPELRTEMLGRISS